MSIHNNRAFIAWLIEVLEDGDLTVGHGQRPDVVPVNSGYVVVYSTAGGTTRGSVNDPRSDAEPNVQVTSWGLDEEQALWLADKVRSLLEAAVPAEVSGGRKVIYFDHTTSSPATGRDDKVQPPLWFAIDRFEFGTA